MLEEQSNSGIVNQLMDRFQDKSSPIHTQARVTIDKITQFVKVKNE